MTKGHNVERKGFTGELWRSIEDVYAGILAHPFLQGLTYCTLSEERFRYYVLHTTFGPQTLFLVMSRAGLTDTAFKMIWRSGVTFLRLDQPLHFHCNDETGWDAAGDDEIELEFGVDNDPLPLFKGSWDYADTGEDWPDFTHQVRSAVFARAGGQVRSIGFGTQITLVVEETGDFEAGSPDVGFVGALSASDALSEESAV